MVNATTGPAKLPEPLMRIIEARHHDPFEVLGRHETDGRVIVRVFLPLAEQVRLVEADAWMQRIEGTDLFVWEGEATALPRRYQIEWVDGAGSTHLHYDPYCFPPLIGDLDLHLFGEGRHWHIYQILGSHLAEVEGIPGVRFAVWAPNAERVSVVGDFNAWDGRTNPMRVRGTSGVWELFIPGLNPGGYYKYELRDRFTHIHLKIDPYAQAFQERPHTAGLIAMDSDYRWGDAEWIERRAKANWQRYPMSIYEVHLGSWRRAPNGGFLDYRTLAHELADYVKRMGFTHVELMPVTEHPLDASWGYQCTGYYAPTSRFGTPDDFRYFVDYLHQQGIGVLLDWVPAHFPKDAYALARFDGTALYEHEDPRLGEHKDWGTLIFNFGRNEVKNFLLASALYWLEEFHIDGLRVDAVASMLYLDYSRAAGEWIPNKYGGNENLEAVDFLRELNTLTHERFPGTLMIAEESTAWPAVSRPTYLGGLGFSMKWNMGWMHDTLAYMQKDPIYRHFHHDLLTFGLLYAFSENFVLPFSHDEVVHGKKSLLDKMPGDPWQRFASVRLLYTYMFAYPGKKLLFMGCEFAQGREWNFAGELDWDLLERPQHQGVQRLVADLNRLYVELPALHEVDFEAAGFEWIDCHDSSQSVLSFLRKDQSGKRWVAAIFNFTPVPRTNYRIGVPVPGFYREAINSDSEVYGGSNVGNQGGVTAEPVSWMGRPYSLRIALPPLAGLILVHESPAETIATPVADTSSEEKTDASPAGTQAEAYPSQGPESDVDRSS